LNLYRRTATASVTSATTMNASAAGHSNLALGTHTFKPHPCLRNPYRLSRTRKSAASALKSTTLVCITQSQVASLRLQLLQRLCYLLLPCLCCVRGSCLTAMRRLFAHVSATFAAAEALPHSLLLHHVLPSSRLAPARCW
jgi:hypothetical protein